MIIFTSNPRFSPDYRDRSLGALKYVSSKCCFYLAGLLSRRRPPFRNLSVHSRKWRKEERQANFSGVSILSSNLQSVRLKQEGGSSSRRNLQRIAWPAVNRANLLDMRTHIRIQEQNPYWIKMQRWQPAFSVLARWGGNKSCQRWLPDIDLTRGVAVYLAFLMWYALKWKQWNLFAKDRCLMPVPLVICFYREQSRCQVPLSANRVAIFRLGQCLADFPIMTKPKRIIAPLRHSLSVLDQLWTERENPFDIPRVGFHGFRLPRSD